MADVMNPADRIIAAADKCAVARGEAMWTDGYRARYEAGAHDPAEAQRLYEKSLAQWREVARLDKQLRRIVLRALREARNG